MNSIVSSLALVLAVGLVLMLIGATNAAALMDKQLTPSLVELDVSAQIMGIDRKYVGRRIALMPINKNLTQEERNEYAESCVGVGLECHLAEKCCTMMCLKFNKRCIYVSP